MIGKPGPFQIIEVDGCGTVDSPIEPPRRRHDCPNYSSCLSIASALNWDSFTCRGCSSNVAEALIWQANQARRKDLVAKRICSIPSIHYTETEQDEPDHTPHLRIVGRR